MHYSKEEKAKWVEEWKGSGSTAGAFAKEKGLIPQTFVGWVKPRPKRLVGFVEMGLKSMPSITGASEILIEKGELKIHIPFGREELRAIMETLGAAL